MRPFRATDAEIAALAGRQHGVVTRSQLLALGLTNATVNRRVSAGRLHRLHRGVFAVGHTVLTVEGRWMALKGRPLEQLLDRAEHLRLVDFSEFAHRSIPPALQAVLSLYTATTPTRSELEERFLRLCDDHGLRRPEVNARIEGIEVDFVWRDKRLIVEVDGCAYHRSPSRFEDDRARCAAHDQGRWRVLRFTWAQVTRRPAWVARALSAGT
jgi:very-short-patch-repair endonuclease